MYAARSATCVFEITGPQTGMKGRFGFFDSPRPCVMIRVSVATVSDLPTPLSAGTYGETPPHYRSTNGGLAATPLPSLASGARRTPQLRVRPTLSVLTPRL